ncbi:MAG TPA: bifunctional precorrin-2 dehydrogenase/sirohydrochlorin ferrochelatase [Tepidisphaeraceae bacterium]|jgi:precorrin-2 dehydrogenase/sirohydrochlorin ferrochelatase|nr:bifunctional precorrin-2 dehydrogenase/sirohydrochlorin ferrochelatase [Tepidisphaeraceae bacterium]
MPRGYPILLDVSNRLIVIVGGGSVAGRKAAGLIEAGVTRIRVVAPEVSDQMPAGVDCVREAYHPQHLEGAALVFAATNSREVNDAVTRDARARGILVNQADDPTAGDFSTPAQLRRGTITIAVSAGNPSLSVFIRDALRAQFDDRWQEMAQALLELRPQLQNDARLDDVSRQKLFRDLASDEAMDVLHRDGVDGLRKWITEKATRQP